MHLRPATTEDMPFVLSSWLQSARGAGDHAMVMPEDYYAGHRPEVEARLRASSVTVACNEDDHAQIFGYAVHAAGALHFVYVKHPFRHCGVARALVQSVAPQVGKRETVVTAIPKRLSKDWNWAAFARKWRLRFNPWAEGRKAA